MMDTHQRCDVDPCGICKAKAWAREHHVGTYRAVAAIEETDHESRWPIEIQNSEGELVDRITLPYQADEDLAAMDVALDEITFTRIGEWDRSDSAWTAPVLPTAPVFWPEMQWGDTDERP